jgi:Bacterial pre-peptidase C-terminal domain
MICPKCKSEQPDNSKFCSQCAAPLVAESNHAKSKMPGWAIFVILALAGICFFLVRNNLQNADRQIAEMKSKASVKAAAPPQPQSHSVVIVNSAPTVNAASYAWYRFSVPAGASIVAVNGHFTATGGAGNDIDCYILDEDGLANFKNGHPANTYFNSGKVTQAKIGAANLAPGTYYIMLDNRFSIITPKAVQVEATLTYMH